MSPRIGVDLKSIVITATEIVDTEGLHALTLASLAKKLNIRPPSLYNHLDGLQGLHEALAIHGLEKLYDCLSEASIGRSKDDAIHAVSKAYMDFARAHPGLYEATLLINPQAANSEIHHSSARILKLIIRILDAYGLEEREAIHASRGLRSILHGFASLEQKKGFGIPIDLDLSITFSIDTFIAGIDKMKLQKNLYNIEAE